LENRLSHAEFIEWLAYMRMEAGGGAPTKAKPWQELMKSMRLASDMLGAARK
jgi:hypothetical protein